MFCVVFVWLQVEYDGQTFRLATAEMCTKFMRSPQTYFEADLPVRRQRRYSQPVSQPDRRQNICDMHTHSHADSHRQKRDDTRHRETDRLKRGRRDRRDRD